MKRLLRNSFTLLKWVVAAVVLVELFSFLVIETSNYWIYGQLRDGDPVRYDPYTLFVRAGGPRPTWHNPPGGASGCKILWLFGGSTMAGATDDDDKTLPSFLAVELNRKEPRWPAHLTNFGEPSFNSLLETKYLQKALIESRPLPQVIIFYDGANDCAYFAQDRIPSAHYGYWQLRGLVESYHYSLFGLLKPLNAALYSSFTKEFYDKIMQGLVAIEPDSPVLRQMVDAAEKRYDYNARLAAAYGARFLLFWQPCWWVENGPVAPAVKAREHLLAGRRSTLRHNFEVTYDALEARLQNKPYFIKFRNILCSRTEPLYQEDGIHLEDAGRALVARHMGAVLKERLAGMAAAGGSAP
jgi:lysophospholipase L1-like esterase